MTAAKTVTLDKLWNSSSWRAQYTGLELAPGEPERTASGALNTYSGYSVHSVAGDVQPFYDLLAHVITRASDRDLFVKYIAYKIQQPQASYSFALVIQSQIQGIGKNLIVETCTQLFDRRHCTVVGQEVFSDQFTEWQHQKLFVVADEVSSSNSRTVADKVKGWITATENSINGKGQPRFTEGNKIAYIFLSNHPDAVYIDAHDRRFAVLQCGTIKLARKDATRFVDWRDNGGGRSHLLDHLLNVDTTGFDPRAHAPMTRAKRDMINANKSDLERWVEAIVTATNITQLLGREIVTAEELAGRYRSTANREVSTKAMGNALSKAGITQLHKQAIRADGTRPRVYALSNAAVYAAHSGKQLGTIMDQNIFKG